MGRVYPWCLRKREILFVDQLMELRASTLVRILLMVLALVHSAANCFPTFQDLKSLMFFAA